VEKYIKDIYYIDFETDVDVHNGKSLKFFTTDPKLL